jgi:mannose/cellobiose epimerase-like protein (N-acyl-D-glucosamine 2-epimerase family)
MRGKALVGFVLLWLFACQTAPPVPEPTSEAVTPPVNLPDAAYWLDHLENELMNYWTAPGATGMDGLPFPTFICLDGSAYDPDEPCPVFADAPGWIKENLGRTYTRMHARQTYAYGAAFHMTGKEEYLQLMKRGVDFLRSQALDRVNGGFVSVFEDGTPVFKTLQRTTQDLAYAQLGLAMYYYLTRDPDVLPDILAVKDHIFSNYWDEEWGMLRWVREDSYAETSDRKELVAQLDQINGYMLVMLPTLVGEQRSNWESDMRRVARALIDHYHIPDEQRFHGVLHDPEQMTPWGRHADFGHTIKAYWMLRQTGTRLNEPEWVALAEKGMATVFERAYLPPSNTLKGRWAEGLRQGGEKGSGASWWAYAELDQAAATMALVDPTHARYLEETYAFWRGHLVDKQHGGVFHGTNANGEPWPMKSHHWKNAYHEVEHALIGMITGEAFAKRPVSLYFAFAETPPDAQITPYFYTGTIAQRETTSFNQHPGLTRVKILFEGVQ